MNPFPYVFSLLIKYYDYKLSKVVGKLECYV